jgi:hypothetical protein
MKNIIKQILREETSDLSDKKKNAADGLMGIITKEYQWYTDTPEQPFEYSEGSIWLINPETKEWMLELDKSGELYYYYKTPDTFSDYLNMDKSDFQSFIKVWVEDALKIGTVSTGGRTWSRGGQVEDVLKRGVVSSIAGISSRWRKVEDVIENGKKLK